MGEGDIIDIIKIPGLVPINHKEIAFIQSDLALTQSFLALWQDWIIHSKLKEISFFLQSWKLHKKNSNWVECCFLIQQNWTTIYSKVREIIQSFSNGLIFYRREKSNICQFIQLHSPAKEGNWRLNLLPKH